MRAAQAHVRRLKGAQQAEAGRVGTGGGAVFDQAACTEPVRLRHRDQRIVDPETRRTQADMRCQSTGLIRISTAPARMPPLRSRSGTFRALARADCRALGRQRWPGGGGRSGGPRSAPECWDS